jgi:gliding motility-associated-like protein
MRTKKLLIIALLLAGALATVQEGKAQNCSVAGQTPGTAFPVCGTTVFKQDVVPQCSNGPMQSPGCTGLAAGLSAVNPFWYKFTCYTPGTLGFLIKPNNSDDDYDWELFDITGRSPVAVLNNASLAIASDWSGVTGNTGASPSGSSLFECGSTQIPPNGPPPFSKMPTLIQGHNYLLMISHFSGDDQSGYSLSFDGGTASITDPTPPSVRSATTICDGSRIEIILNKPMTCSSLAADGSDFVLSGPAGLKVVGAYAANCSGFDLDTLVAVVNGPLAPGNYSLTVATGTDGNTLIDNCGAEVPVGQSIPFTMVLPQPTLMDSITTPVGCAPNTLQLVFKKKMYCSSIAADGSDFSVTGTSSITVTGAHGQCDTGDMTYRVIVQLSAPIQTAGNFSMHLSAGTDGNTLIDECGLASPPGSLPFTTGDTVSAGLLTDQILLGCKSDTIIYQYPSTDGVNQWQWIFDNADTSLLQDPPMQIYSAFGTKNVRLVVSNGYCTDTANFSPVLGNAIKAALEAPNILCPKDEANYLNKSSGTLTSWNWDFGDGAGFSGETAPNHLYPPTGIETRYTVTLVVGNAIGCYDTAAQQIDVLRSCYIAVPNAFTPNGDGVNDYLYPLNAFKADHLTFKVFNRQGQMVYESHEWTAKWDGTVHGHAEPSGTFVWMLDYVDRDSGKHIFQKGTALLIR